MDPDNSTLIRLGSMLLALTLLLNFKAAHSEETPKATAAGSKVLAVVEGHKITQVMLDRYKRQRTARQGTDQKQQTRTMVEELINRELIYMDAIKNKLDKQTSVKAAIENQRINIIASAMLKKIAETNSITDADLKKEYDKNIGKMATLEYKARHILVTTEAEAKNMIKQLNQGADFAKLAKAKSTGPSGKDDGNLGWFKSNQMVKPFSEAVAKLNNGGITQKPVKTEFGWHIIKRDDSRKLPPPLFDTMKEQVRMRLKNKQVENYIGSLRSKAAIARSF